MKTYKIEFTKSALKEFKKVSKKIRDKLLEALELLATNPYSELIKSKKIRGAQNLFRIRIGDYRVVYEVQKNILKIIVIKIGHRREVYRKF